jgi:metallo-beta-lactamase class B
MIRAATLGVLLFAAVVLAVGTAVDTHNDAQPFPPYRISGNLYYVGTNDITSYLVTTPAGHIVINEGYEETAALIRDSIEKLGFHAHDVKILLNGQGHFDHVAGLAALQKYTGAQIYSSAAEVPVLESGGKADFRFGNEYTYPPVKVDRVLKDGDTVILGGVTLTAHVTGGHSVGCTTWTLQVDDTDNPAKDVPGKRYDVVIVGGTTINPGVTLWHNAKYPAVSDDFARTFRVLRSLHCDIFLGAHGGYYGMLGKYERFKRGERPNPFIDPEGYRAHIDAAEKRYQDQLARERN